MNDFLLSDRQFLIPYLQKNNIFLKKKYGQNFVIDQSLLDTVIQTADLQPDDVVLEIGAGVGSLTERLLAQGSQVIAVEIDPQLGQLLITHFGHQKKISLIEGDVLKRTTLEQIQAQIPTDGRKLKVVANVPYYITTPIITTLLTRGFQISDMIFTIQKEVAERLVALPGCKQYSAITVFLQYYGDTYLVESFPPTSFFPSPRVWSSIIHFMTHDERPCTAQNPLFFHHCVKLCFTERRKMVKNSIAHVIKGWEQKPDMTWIENMLQQLEVSPEIRPEQIWLEQFVDITDQLWNIYPDTLKSKWLP